jgi:hypothetical protein
MRCIAYVLLSLSLFVVISCPARAQGLLGTIVGTVTDSSGASISDVDVTVKSQATNLTIKGKTQTNGLYQVPNLQFCDPL